MFFFKMLIFSSILFFLTNFHKKLVPLLALELMMITMIFCFFISLSNFPLSSFSFCLIFLVMMVLDSVTGLCLLVVSCRHSTYMSCFLS